jgi:hypothetical protein
LKYFIEAQFALGIEAESPEHQNANFLGFKKRPKEAIFNL